MDFLQGRVIATAFVLAGLAQAVTITVPCSGSGGGASGLIAAIEKANSTPGANTINLTPGCVYVLTALYPGESANGLPPITGTITIDGYGATIERSHASGTPPFRIFAVASGDNGVTSGTGDLTLNTVTLKGGKAYHNDFGNNLCEDGGTPYANDQGYGGGICVEGTLTLNHSTVTGNSEINNSNHNAEGGGLNSNFGSNVTLTYSVVSENVAIGNPEAAFFAFGGGIESDGTLTLDHSTVTHNTAETLGNYGGNADFAGGIDSEGSLIMRDTVVSYNVAKTTGDDPFTDAGGIYIGGTAMLERCEIRDNVALAEGTGQYTAAEGGGMEIGGTATLKHTLVFSNTATVGASVSATAEGGGIAVDAGPPGVPVNAKLTLDDTDVHCNIARALKGLAQGGGIYNSATGTSSLDVSKVTENAAQGNGIDNSQGGGIYNGNTASGSVTLTDSTVKDNHPNQCDPTGSVPGCSN